MTLLAAELAEATLRLVAIASESRREEAIVEAIRAQLDVAPGLGLVEDADSVLVALPSRRRETPLVVLAGHVDTVPAAGTRAPDLGDDGTVVGRGAADMKGGLAVMLRLAADGAGGPDVDLGFVCFGREELPISESALLPAFERCPQLREASLAIVLEPTANDLEVGCNGNLNATVQVSGRAAHSARPWLGANAIHAAIEALAPIAELPIRDVEIDGLVFREAISVTEIHAGIAANVVPDRLVAHVNMRYAPSQTPTGAEARLRELLDHRRATIEIVGNAPPGPVCLDNPLVTRLRTAGDLAVRPKQAWTPVAEFAMAGVDAVNLGPGDPRYAHADDEQVSGAALARTHAIVSAFLAGVEA
jgi:succinyl-diaminopimelate desuccinylase